MELALREKRIDDVKALLHNRTSTLPWHEDAVRPDVCILETAVMLYPTDKNLILCIMMHLPIMKDDACRVYAQACKLAATEGCDLLVPLTIMSKINDEVGMAFAFDAEMFRVIACRQDLRVKVRRVWLNIYHVAFPSISLGGSCWVKWLADLPQDQRNMFFAWRLDVEAADKSRSKRHVPLTEAEKKEQEANDAIHVKDWRFKFDVHALEIQRDVERGRDPEDAKSDADRHRMWNKDSNSTVYRLPWGQKKPLELPEDLQDVHDGKLHVKRIRWALDNKIYRPQREHENHTMYYLSSVQDWIELIPSQDELDQLLVDYAHLLTHQMLGLNTEKHVDWLITLGRFDDANTMIATIPLTSLSSFRRLFDRTALASSPEREDFALDILYEHPDVMKHIENQSCPGYQMGRWHASSLMYLAMISEGAHEFTGVRYGCDPFVDGARLRSRNMPSEYPMDFEERWAMVQVLRMQFHHSGSELWYERIMSATPNEEIPFWLQWSIERGFQKYGNASVRCLGSHGTKYIGWFAKNYFGPPHLGEIFSYTPHDQSVDLLKAVLAYWPTQLALQSRQADFLFTAISRRDIAMARFLHEEHKLTIKHNDMERVLAALLNPDHTCKHPDKYDKSINPKLLEHHRQMLEWVFHTFADVIEEFYQKAETCQWGPRCTVFDSTAAGLCEDQINTCKWVEQHCQALTSFKKRQAECVIEAKERQAERKRQEEVAAARRRDDYYYDDDYYSD